MNALVEQTAFGVTTSSRTVAEVFEKEHRDVLRSIDAIIEKRADLCARNFARTSVMVPMPNGGTREVRAYEMDRDGFTLVAMGFTGEKALDWKIAYIEAFNRMEAELESRGRVAPIDPIDLAPALAVIREARLLFGRRAARALWPQLGLPEVDQDDVLASEQAPGAMRLNGGMVGRFLRQTCEIGEDSRMRPWRVMKRDLFELYQAWCGQTGSQELVEREFARQMVSMGASDKHSNGAWWIGIRPVVTLDEIINGSWTTDGTVGVMQ